MMDKVVYEAVDRMLQDVCETSDPFGGKVVVLAGDWRQILPVVQHGSRSQVVNSTLVRSNLWRHFVVHHFDTNMRVFRLLQAREI